MKVLGRTFRLAELSTRIGSSVLASVKLLYLFKHPFSMLRHYIRMTSPTNSIIELRNGWKLTLSSHPHDLTTAAIVFCKQDYGNVLKGSIVIDIGANIGSFALYAAYKGAKSVFAFEPNKEAYECLVKNVKQNGLEDVIVPFKLAVSTQTHQPVKFPLSASPYNRIQDFGVEPTQEYEMVDTIALSDILEQNGLDNVYLLKMDCEGQEYAIVLSGNAQVWDKINNVRLEYHQGPLKELITGLQAHGFSLIRHKKEQVDSGILWFSKPLKRHNCST